MNDVEGYIIYASSATAYDFTSNAYGYYQGKTYQCQQELFPITSSDVKEAKVYKSVRRAKMAAEALFIKCDYIKVCKVFKKTVNEYGSITEVEVWKT